MDFETGQLVRADQQGKADEDPFAGFPLPSQDAAAAEPEPTKEAKDPAADAAAATEEKVEDPPKEAEPEPEAEKPAEPVEPEKPAEPKPEPEKPAEPVEPVKPAEPAPEPEKPAEPVEPEKPAEPEPEPAKPAEPEPEPVKPAEPAGGTEPAQPEPAAEPDEKEAEQEAFVAVRKEIRKASPEEQQRYVNAIKTMMKNKDGPDTSEWLRVAGYHGDFCAHRNEQFPGWHRAYLCELEAAIQKADIENGGDGKMGIMYWDWADHEMNKKEMFPKIIRENFKGMKGLKEDPDWHLNIWDFENASDEEIRMKIEWGRTAEISQFCLLEDQHYKHAAANLGGDGSVEKPHDQVYKIRF